jgi:FAD:protein FMN transferase
MLDANLDSKTHRFAHKAMATVFEITCEHENPAYASQAASAAFELIDRLETELTGFRASSDISRINRLQAGEATPVGLWTMECLLMARHFFAETAGAFDISLGTGLDSLELLVAEPAVRARKPGVRLNLGGIGKGYAIDRAAELLQDWEVTRALLHGGYSSVLALDPPHGREGWPLTLSVPESEPPKTAAKFLAKRQSWSASGIQKKDHILNPRTGTPVRSRQAVWVSGEQMALAALFPRETIAEPRAALFETGISPSAVAEVLSTAFMILSLEEISGFLLSHAGATARVLRLDPARSSHVLITFDRG